MRAAIYCRVSTEDQEREGTSLLSQREACEKLAQEHGYHVPDGFCFIETYSGLSLERPKLDELRVLVRDRSIDCVIAFALDRFSRDPVHFILIQEEMERSGVDLLLVTEDVDSSDMGKLIAHIKGFAAKLEAEKIKERTMRGLKERAKAGKIPSGRRGRLYGYTYLPDQGIRCVNEDEAKWVRQVFHWFVNEGIGIDRIAFKLRDLGIPTPSGKGMWQSSEVWRTLQHRGYIGETYAFTQTFGEPKKRLSKGSKTRKTGLIKKPKEEWIEIPNATPPIIDAVTFDMAQVQLKRNKERAGRNKKQEYLLSDHIKCQRCNRNYWGFVKRIVWGKKSHPKRYYHCPGKLKRVSPIQCDNHNLNADDVEELIWKEVEQILYHPQLVLAELERRKKESGQENLLDQELNRTEIRLAALDREQGELLQWALKGFPEETIVKENEKINHERISLTNRREELHRRIAEAKENQIDADGIERFCDLVKNNLKSFGYKEKRLALEALQVKVWIDGENISIHGAIPVITGHIASTLPA